MEPRDGFAVCPVCRYRDAAAVQPLFIVTGASGSGKTAASVPLARRLQGQCITFDADWLLDAAGELSADQPIRWPAFRDAWLAVAHGVAQSGMPTVLLGPLIPQHLDGRRPAAGWEKSTSCCSTAPMICGANESRLVPPGGAATSRSRPNLVAGCAATSPTTLTPAAGRQNDVAAVIAAWVAGHMAQRS